MVVIMLLNNEGLHSVCNPFNHIKGIDIGIKILTKSGVVYIMCT